MLSRLLGPPQVQVLCYDDLLSFPAQDIFANVYDRITDVNEFFGKPELQKGVQGQREKLHRKCKICK